MMIRSLAQSYILLSWPEDGKLSAFSVTDSWLIAAGLLELMLSGTVAIEGDKLAVLGELPEEQAYLEVLYKQLQGSDTRLELLITSLAIADFGKPKRQLLDDVLDALVEDGAMTSEVKATRFSEQTRYLPVPARRHADVEALRETMLDGEPSREGLALAMMLDKSGELQTYFSPYERKQFHERLEGWQANAEIQSVAEMIDATTLITSLLIAYIAAM